MALAVIKTQSTFHETSRERRGLGIMTRLWIGLLLGVALQKNGAVCERRLAEEISTGGSASDLGQMQRYVLEMGHQIRRQLSTTERAIDLLRDAMPNLRIFKDQVRSAVQACSLRCVRCPAETSGIDGADPELLQSEEVAKRATSLVFRVAVKRWVILQEGRPRYGRSRPLELKRLERAAGGHSQFASKDHGVRANMRPASSEGRTSRPRLCGYFRRFEFGYVGMQKYCTAGSVPAAP